MNFILGFIAILIILAMGMSAAMFHWLWGNITGILALLYIKSILLFGLRLFDKSKNPLYYIFTVCAMMLDFLRDYYLSVILNMIFVDVFQTQDIIESFLNLIVSPLALLITLFVGTGPMSAVYPFVFGLPQKEEVPFSGIVWAIIIGAEILGIILLFLLKLWWS